MSHTPLTHPASTTPERTRTSPGALALAALVAAAFPVAMLSLAFPALVGFLTVGIGSLVVAGRRSAT